MDLNTLIQDRASLVANFRTMVEDAESRGSVTSEDLAAQERISEEIRGLDARIKAANDLREFESFEAPTLGQESQSRQADLGESADGEAEYREAFDRLLRGQADGADHKTLRTGYIAEEGRDMTKGVAAKGGYISPTEFDTALQARVEELSTVRRLFDVLRTGNGNKITRTVEDARGAAAWLDESAPFVATDDTFLQYDIEAWKSGRLVKESIEVVEDAMFPLQPYLAKSVGESLAELEAAAFVNGDGVKKPQGFMVDAQVAFTSAVAAASITNADEIIDLIYSVRPTYRQRGTFVIADLAVKALRKLKDSQGQFIWQDGMRAGEPNSLFGYPVHVETNMPTPAVNAKPIAFGDFSRYLVREVAGTRVAFLAERYLADEGKYGYLAWRRVDGQLLDPAAVKVIQQKAT